MTRYVIRPYQGALATPERQSLVSTFRSSDPPKGVHRSFVILATYAALGPAAQLISILSGHPVNAGLRFDGPQPAYLPYVMLGLLTVGGVLAILVLVLMRAGRTWARLTSTGIGMLALAKLADTLISKAAPTEGNEILPFAFDGTAVIPAFGLIIIMIAMTGMYNHVDGYFFSSRPPVAHRQ